ARHETPLQPEPPEGAHPDRRRAAPRVRLHALPEGREGPEGRL
ncbi:MAG: LSU ribosomal protein L28p @ LSU ribosomal protein L28p, zinc-dependent, partial [uncultured Solirubrobacteraceae bacterium]